mmetsp:Transcript_11446/g.25868  ORF Transcript_11446/g.25868 Transcript_11446/m.25868 type:complete len:220 (-) Transcript_11446:7-666(-)
MRNWLTMQHLHLRQERPALPKMMPTPPPTTTTIQRQMMTTCRRPRKSSDSPNTPWRFATRSSNKREIRCLTKSSGKHTLQLSRHDRRTKDQQQATTTGTNKQPPQPPPAACCSTSTGTTCQEHSARCRRWDAWTTSRRTDVRTCTELLDSNLPPSLTQDEETLHSRSRSSTANEVETRCRRRRRVSRTGAASSRKLCASCRRRVATTSRRLCSCRCTSC